MSRTRGPPQPISTPAGRPSQGNSGADHPLAKPFRQFRLTAGTGGDRLHPPQGICRIEAQTKSIVRQKQTRRHPGGAFVAICKCMASRQGAHMRRPGRLHPAICRLQGRVDGQMPLPRDRNPALRRVPHAGQSGDHGLHKERFLQPIANTSPGQRLQNVPIIVHDVLRKLNLALELGVVGREPVTIRPFRQKQRISFFHFQGE